MFELKKDVQEKWEANEEKPIYLTNKNVAHLPTLKLANNWFLNMKSINLPNQK
jgi:hypothetical protein